MMSDEWVLGVVFVLVGVSYFVLRNLFNRIGEDE
jgi:hypothetical protein